MKFLEIMYARFGKKMTQRTIVITIVVVILGSYFLATQADTPLVTVTENKKGVTIQKAGALSGAQNFTAIGSVTAVSEARLVTERSGRVTGVYAGIGDSVPAGKILAELENSSERASLLQAQGAYESALVSGVGADISLAEAKTGAQNEFRSTFTIADDTIRSLVDEFFSNPTERNIAFRLNGDGQAGRLNAERTALETVLKTWESSVSTNTGTIESLNDAERDLIRVGTFVSELSFILADQKPNKNLTETDIGTYKARFTVARTRIDSGLQSISRARNTLLQAEQSASNNTATSESDARIKQALGGLRAAQSAYEKTLVRTPITGVVNAFYLKANDNVSQGVPAAIVANNGALEITTAISDDDRSGIAIGDMVTLDQNSSGTITRIAPAIDPTTGKVEVRIGVAPKSIFKNGDTVTVQFTRKSTGVTKDKALLVPISAFKITATGPVAFTLDGESKLVPVPVTLGAIQGEMVVVKEGLDAETEIVTDARGLKAGEVVTVTK